MGERVKKGDKIPFTLQLSNEITDAFVEATLLDDQEVELLVSPIELIHVADGHYVNNAITMPDDSNRIFAIVRIYTDNTKVQRHPQHDEALEDIFPRDFVQEIIANLDIGDLNNLLKGVFGSFNATIEIQDFNATIEKAIELTATIDEDELTASVNIEDESTSTIESKEFNATIDKDC